MVSSRSFIVSGLTFRSLIHFEFIFVCGVRKWSSFILLPVVDQLSEHSLLKILSFLHCMFFFSFVKDKISIGAWIYLWAFYFVPLIYISVFVSTTILKHQFFGGQIFLWSSSPICTWLLEKPQLWLYGPLPANWWLRFLISA